MAHPLDNRNCWSRPAWRRKSGLLALLAVAAVAQSRPNRAVASGPPAKTHAVRAVHDLTYYNVPNDPDAARHKLDVYRPAGKGPYPVLLFLHGGGWVAGSKDDVFGVYGYGTIARCLAERGLVVVLPNYRLSPRVRHPEHIKDVARAFAWTHRHCAKYGGDPRRLFVGGHSAGGHLAALLAVDATYLKGVGRSAKEIRGVIGVSGVYRLDEFDVKWRLSGLGSRVRVNVQPLAAVFGDKQAIRQAAPITHVRPGLPPFLLLNGGWDYPPMRRMAKEFAAALRKQHCDVRKKQVPRRTHETLLFDIPRLSAERATVNAIVTFIDQAKSKKSSASRKK